MEINFLKLDGGYFVPASAHEQQRFKRFPNNIIYKVKLILCRNYEYHKKVFKFFNFCFNYWNASNAYPFLDEQLQRETFRDKITIMAGFYRETFDLDGRLELKPKSWSYANMNQEEFESLYHSLIQVAMHKIFKTDDKKILGKLYQFFD